MFRSKPTQIILLAMAALIGVFAITALDVTLRARRAYLNGERHLAWHADPSSKQQVLDLRYEQKKKKLEQRKSKGRLTEDDYQSQVDLLEFDRSFHQNESDLKYAYQWFKDAYELFSPPESTWVKKARVKAEQTFELWTQELREKNIPFDETTLR